MTNLELFLLTLLTLEFLVPPLNKRYLNYRKEKRERKKEDRWLFNRYSDLIKGLSTFKFDPNVGYGKSGNRIEGGKRGSESRVVLMVDADGVIRESGWSMLSAFRDRRYNRAKATTYRIRGDKIVKCTSSPRYKKDKNNVMNFANKAFINYEEIVIGFIEKNEAVYPRSSGFPLGHTLYDELHITDYS